VNSDWLTQVEGEFDVVVSNPPYIPSHEIAELDPEVRDHDPHRALDGGADGLFAIRSIAAQAPARLKSPGWLLFEVGQGQAQATSLLLQERGYRDVSVYADISGIDRIVEARWEGRCPGSSRFQS
jgi:release factor glutamine methyltransferase